MPQSHLWESKNWCSCQLHYPSCSEKYQSCRWLPNGRPTGQESWSNRQIEDRLPTNTSLDHILEEEEMRYKWETVQSDNLFAVQSKYYRIFLNYSLWHSWSPWTAMYCPAGQEKEQLFPSTGVFRISQASLSDCFGTATRHRFPCESHSVYEYIQSSLPHARPDVSEIRWVTMKRQEKIIGERRAEDEDSDVPRRKDRLMAAHMMKMDFRKKGTR